MKRLGYVGEITSVNAQPILDLLEKDYIPVVSTVGCDLDGNTYNINADTAAAHIAGGPPGGAAHHHDRHHRRDDGPPRPPTP